MDLFHCADCDFKSARASSFKCYQLKCYSNIYKCQFCSELFRNKMLFLKHMELHTTDSVCDVRDHMCEDNCHFKCKYKYQSDKNHIYKPQHEEERQNDKKHTIIKKCEFENVDLQESNNRSLNGLNRELSLLNENKFFKFQMQVEF